MIDLIKNIFREFCVWGYYRIGWIRAAFLGVKLDWRARISPYAEIRGVISIGNTEIGRDVQMGRGTYAGSGLIQSAEIGNYCSIGPEVIIGPTEHRLDHWTTSPYEAKDAGELITIANRTMLKPIIEDGVWIGARVIILRGCRIGKRSVIAAGAVVCQDVPPGEIWGGVPAKRIKKLDKS